MALTFESVAGISGAKILAGTPVPLNVAGIVQNVVLSGIFQQNDIGGDVYAMVYPANVVIPLSPLTPPSGIAPVHFTPPAPVNGRISVTLGAANGIAAPNGRYQLAVWVNWTNTSQGVPLVGPAVLPFNT